MGSMWSTTTDEVLLNGSTAGIVCPGSSSLALIVRGGSPTAMHFRLRCTTSHVVSPKASGETLAVIWAKKSGGA